MTDAKTCITLDKLWELAKEYHERFCDLPCFTYGDVADALVAKLVLGKLVDDEKDGRVITVWGSEFSGFSYIHFVESLNEAILRLEEEYEEAEGGEI